MSTNKQFVFNIICISYEVITRRYGSYNHKHKRHMCMNNTHAKPQKKSINKQMHVFKLYMATKIKNNSH